MKKNLFLIAEDERDLLEDQEFLHFSKILCKDLEYLLNMKFIQKRRI